MTGVDRIRELEIEACWALKQGKTDSAERIWQSMLIHAKIIRDDTREDREPEIIQSLQNLLVFAVRNHKEFLLERWLMDTWQVVSSLRFYEELGEFVNNIAFVATDRKVLQILPVLQVILKQYLRLAKYYYPLDNFAREWLSTTAEIFARGLSECSIFLVQGYLRMLYMQNDWDFIFKQLREYYFHFQVASQRYGYEKAYQNFGLIHYLEIILSERINRMPEGMERVLVAKRFYRGMVYFVSNIARVTSRNEKDILLTWQKLAIANESPKFKQRFQKFYNLVLMYWQELNQSSYLALGLGS